MRQTIQYFTAAILLLVVAFHALTPDAQAISPQEDGSSMRHLSMVLLGDSYSAGNGAGGYDFWHSEFRTKKDLSYRSDANWANHYRGRLLQEGISAPLTNHAHSGFKTSDVLGDPIKSIPADVDIIMLTIGGNDIGFGDVVSQCFALGLRDPLGCRNAIIAPI